MNSNQNIMRGLKLVDLAVMMACFTFAAVALFALAGDDTVILWRDRSRDLPHTDPFHRQLVISLGCFLEQMKIAAAEKHIGVRFTLYPTGERGRACCRGRL